MTLVYPPRQRQIQQLARKLGLPEKSPVRWDLLDLALTHPTAHPERNYERLEFVGDAVVRLAVAAFLWEEFSSASVGEFSAVRSILVSDRVLAEISEAYGLERYLAPFFKRCKRSDGAEQAPGRYSRSHPRRSVPQHPYPQIDTSLARSPLETTYGRNSERPGPSKL